MVDDHPILRAGLVGVLKGEPGIVPVAAAASAAQARAHAEQLRPDVAIVDYQLTGDGDDGLLLALDLKRLPASPRVIIYSGYAEPELALGAALVGADGLLDKAAPVDEIFETIRAVAGGERRLPQPPPDVVAAAGSAIEPADRPIFAMALAGEPIEEMAPVLGVGGTEEALVRLRSLVGRLGPANRSSSDWAETGS